MKHTLSTVAITLLAVVLLGAVVVVSGALSVAADEPHSSLVFGILDTARERSIEARADDIQVPALDDAGMVRRGAGNYDAMCAKCHLAPAMAPTELNRGLSPTPPNLAKDASADAAEAFWVIKHGIKATGMPAWGKHMEDQYIWDVVAFLRKLPSLSVEQYQAEVAASGGHSHGGSASAEHSHRLIIIHTMGMKLQRLRISMPMAPSTRTLRQPTDRSVPRRRFTMHCQTATPLGFKVFSIPK